MPSINDTSATKALNEDQYINKLYDNAADKQKTLLGQNYTEAGAALDAEKQSVQQQADTNLGRVNVEAQRLQDAYKGPKLSAGAQQQAALAMDNQQKKNVSTMQTAQSEADAEIERQRKLLAEQYSAAIKKLQADNDMARAQQLYEAAKAEDEQLLALKREAGTTLADKGDNSILQSLLQPNPITRDTESETWAEVLKREGDINKIYDSAIESDRQAAQMALNKELSKLDASQAAQRAATDKNLTQTYVNALKNARNYDEVQNAYGLGSGTLAQARLSRELSLTGDLTELRGVQLGKDAKLGQQRFDAGQTYRETLAKSLGSNEQKRAQELYNAAEGEEQNLIATQKAVGNALAEQGDYSILAKLWGLTPDQVDRLQGTGIYAPGGRKEDIDSSYLLAGALMGGTAGAVLNDDMKRAIAARLSGAYSLKQNTSASPPNGAQMVSFDEPGASSENSSGTAKSGNSSGTTKQVDPSILALGYGPIDKEGLAKKVENGEVTAIKTSEGTKYVKNNTASGSIDSAALQGRPVFESASSQKSTRKGNGGR